MLQFSQKCWSLIAEHLHLQASNFTTDFLGDTMVRDRGLHFIAQTTNRRRFAQSLSELLVSRVDTLLL